MEPEEKLLENESNKRKHSEAELDLSDPKRVLLESSVSSTTLTSEVSTSATAPDILLPSSSGEVSKPSESNKNIKHDNDPHMDIPTSSISLVFDYSSDIESPSSSVVEDVNNEVSCASTKEDSHIETKEVDIDLIESLSDVSSNIIEPSSEPDGNKFTEENETLNIVVQSSEMDENQSTEEKKTLNIENQVVSSSVEFDDKDNVIDEKDNDTSSTFAECEKNISQVEEEISVNETGENKSEAISEHADEVENKLNISSTNSEHADEVENKFNISSTNSEHADKVENKLNISSTNSEHADEVGNKLNISSTNSEHADEVENKLNISSTNSEHADKVENKLNISSTTEVDKDDKTNLAEKSDHSSLPIAPLNEINSELPSQSSVQESEQFENVIDDSDISDIVQVKSSCTEAKEISEACTSLGVETKENLTFKGTFKNISHNDDDDMEVDKKEPELSISPVVEESQEEKVDSSFVPIPHFDSPLVTLANEPDAEQDKKSEISTMEIDSINHTPIEGSLVDTPCDSGETSPSTSTPADSCQVSAAPSPLLKEDANLLYDESSLDTKDVPEETEEDREMENIKPVRFGRRRKKRLVPKYKRGRGKSTPVLVDEETRMSATGTPDIGLDEDSQSSVGTTSKREPRRYRSEVIVPESTDTFTAEKVVEYIWPLEGENGEHFFIQEHISQFLGIISFKRRYPDLRRRAIESQEKEYLKDLGLVTEIACDLGLTAVRSEDMLDIMFTDFPNKYEELQKVLRDRKEKQLKEEKGKVEYQIVGLDKSKMQEYSRKASLNASKWNAAFNRERFEERRYCFDLQTFSLHMPAGQAMKISPAVTKMGSYPVAVLPGQFTDYCKRYTASELKGMPLQTVLAGPFTAEELAAEMQEDSDDDDGSAVASIETCSEIKEEPDVPPVVDPMSAEKQPRCKVCNGGRARNKDGKPEPLIICGTCRTASHPTCIDLTLAMIDKIESYCWQCMDCKTCAQCNDPDDEERMIFCDMCDRGYHIYCVGLRRVPNGRWHCKECAICFTCGSRNPSGNEHIKNAEWQHEFKKDKTNKQMKYACTLCMPCDKYWKRRQFCSVCMKVYRSIPEDGMVRCLGCPKYVHKDGCSILHENERYCNYCFKSRNKTALNHSRIIAAAKKKMATGNPLWK